MTCGASIDEHLLFGEFCHNYYETFEYVISANSLILKTSKEQSAVFKQLRTGAPYNKRLHTDPLDMRTEPVSPRSKNQSSYIGGLRPHYQYRLPTQAEKDSAIYRQNQQQPA